MDAETVNRFRPASIAVRGIMKILLTAINAKYIHSNPAVHSLRAYAAEFTNQIEIAEFTINNRPDDMLRRIYAEKPDILCFSCYIWNLAAIEEVAEEYRKLCSDVPIWIGGPEVSYETERFLKEHPAVTGVMIGEGEETFLQLCRYYAHIQEHAKSTGREAAFFSTESGGTDLSGIRGIAFRNPGGNEILFTEPREVLSFDRIPFPYSSASDFKNRIIYYESGRGCPFHCSYCLSSVEKSLRFRDMKQVKEELAFFLRERVPQVKFVDRTFNCNHGHAAEIWRFLKENDNGITNFHFEISADLLNEEELKLLSGMRPGLVQLEIGVQTVNPITLREIKRTTNLEKLKEHVKRIQRGGNIHQHLDLIAGLPYEDYRSFAHSFDEIYALKPNQLQLGFLKVLKGSFLYEHRDEYGILYHTKPPYEVLRTNWLSYEELLKIRQAEEMLEVYYNSGQFEITMKILEQLFYSPFEMYREMGAFYERNGYGEMCHSRIGRCGILLEFLEECIRIGTSLGQAENAWEYELFRALNEKTVMRLDCLERLHSVIKESLTFDLYYRENMKSRPSFAPDVAEFKEQTRRFCKKGRKSHVEPFHYRFPGKEEKTVKEMPENLADPIYVLFYYDDRDPLDHQAKVTIVKLEDV